MNDNDIDLSVAELFETVLHQTATQLQAKVPHDADTVAQLERLKSLRYVLARTVLRMMPVDAATINEQLKQRNWPFFEQLAGAPTTYRYVEIFEALPPASQDALIQRAVYLLRLLAN